MPVTASMSNLVVVAAIGIVLIVLMLVLLVAMRPKARKPLKAKQYNAELYRRRMTLDEMPYEVVHDVRVRGSDNRVIRVDHVVRLPASVLMITSGPADVAGQVKANPNAGAWRYIAGDGQVKTMPNPVLQCHPLIQAVRSRFPLVRVRVLTVFPSSATFGGGPAQDGLLQRRLREDAEGDGNRGRGREPGPGAGLEPLAKAFMQASQGVAQSAARAGAPPGTDARRAVS